MVMTTNTITAIAIAVTAAATVVYAIWAKAQETKARERQELILNNTPVPPAYDNAYVYGLGQQTLYPVQYAMAPQQCVGYPVYNQPVGYINNPFLYNTASLPNNDYEMYYQNLRSGNTEYQTQQPIYQQPQSQDMAYSRRYITQHELNQSKLQRMAQPINMTTNMMTPSFAIPGMPETVVDNTNNVYEDHYGHREMVDMHEWELPPHKDPYNGREYTKIYDYDHHYCEPADYLEKEFYYNQPMQKNVQFNAQSIDSGNWYNQPFGIPYFRHMNDDDYKKNDQFNRDQQDLGIYYTPTQEYAMKGEPMPRILSPNANKYDKSSLPYVAPEEKYAYMTNAQPKMCNTLMCNNDTNTKYPISNTNFIYPQTNIGYVNATWNPKSESYEYNYSDRPNEDNFYGAYLPINQPMHVTNNVPKMNESFYSKIINMSDEQFNYYMNHKDDPKTEKFVGTTYSGHGEICGPENGGPDLSKYPMRTDRPDPRRKTYIFNPAIDPKPLVKREGVPLSSAQIHQYWVDNGEAENCGYSYGDPTRPTTPVGTHYAAPQPWEDASYYNALFVDGGGIHFNYQDMLYEIRYRNTYSHPEDDPLTHLCPYDFETRTDLYHWRQAVFKKYKYDPYPFAKSDDIWRDDVCQFEYFQDNFNPNIELAKVAHFRWYRQEKELEALRRERRNRERKARRDFYIDRCKGIHNIAFCPLDPTEYIPPDYYEDMSGNIQQHPYALEDDYWKTMMNCAPGKYYESNKKKFGYDKLMNQTETYYGPSGFIDYFDEGYTWIQDPMSGDVRYMKPPKQMSLPKPVMNNDWKAVWVTPNPVYDISPLVYNEMSNEEYFQLMQKTGFDKESVCNYDMRLNTPEWFNPNRFWNSIPGDALLPYEEKKMRKEYPAIIDNRINENMIIGEQTMQNTAGLPDDPFADVFNFPDWYPNAREINNLLNRMQAPRGFRFTGDPEVDRARLHYFISKDTKTDLEKITIIDNRMRDHLNEPGYSPYKPSKVDGLSDMQKFEILKHNIGPGFNCSDWPELDNVVARTWVFVGDEDLDDVYDAWENEHFRKPLSECSYS